MKYGSSGGGMKVPRRAATYDPTGEARRRGKSWMAPKAPYRPRPSDGQGRAYPLPGPRPAFPDRSVRNDLTDAIAASERRAMMEAMRGRGY